MSWLGSMSRLDEVGSWRPSLHTWWCDSCWAAYIAYGTVLRKCAKNGAPSSSTFPFYCLQLTLKGWSHYVALSHRCPDMSWIVLICVLMFLWTCMNMDRYGGLPDDARCFWLFLIVFVWIWDGSSQGCTAWWKETIFWLFGYRRCEAWRHSPCHGTQPSTFSHGSLVLGILCAVGSWAWVSGNGPASQLGLLLRVQQLRLVWQWRLVVLNLACKEFVDDECIVWGGQRVGLTLWGQSSKHPFFFFGEFDHFGKRLQPWGEECQMNCVMDVWSEDPVPAASLPWELCLSSSRCGRLEWLLNLLNVAGCSWTLHFDAARLNRGFNLALGKYLAFLIGPRAIMDRRKNVNKIEKTWKQRPDQLYDCDTSSLVMDVTMEYYGYDMIISPWQSGFHMFPHQNCCRSCYSARFGSSLV